LPSRRRPRSIRLKFSDAGTNSGSMSTPSPARAREELLRSEERFFKVFQASPVAIILRTLAEGRVIDINERYADLVGFKREEMIGRTVHELGLWADPSEGERIIDRLRREGALHNVEGRFRHSSGGTRDVLIWADLTEIDGQTVIIGLI